MWGGPRVCGGSVCVGLGLGVGLLLTVSGWWVGLLVTVSGRGSVCGGGPCVCGG